MVFGFRAKHGFGVQGFGLGAAGLCLFFVPGDGQLRAQYRGLNIYLYYFWGSFL